MKLKTLAVAALFSVAAPAVVFAQAASPAPAPAVTTTSAMGAGSSMSNPTDFNAFLQGFESANFTSATSGIDTATSFNVVKLSSLPNADAAKLQTAIQPHQQDIQGLSAQIGANAKAKAALDAQGLQVADVVWVNKDPNGMWTLYVNDLGASASGAAAAGSTNTNGSSTSSGSSTTSTTTKKY